MPSSSSGSGNAASTSEGRALPDLNGSASDPELAPPSGLRTLQEENLRLRQEHAELLQMAEEELRQLEAALNELKEQDLLHTVARLLLET